VFYLTKSTIVK